MGGVKTKSGPESDSSAKYIPVYLETNLQGAESIKIQNYETQTRLISVFPLSLSVVG